MLGVLQSQITYWIVQVLSTLLLLDLTRFGQLGGFTPTLSDDQEGKAQAGNSQKDSKPRQSQRTRRSKWLSPERLPRN
jgi:hypothetical protein